MRFVRSRRRTPIAVAAIVALSLTLALAVPAAAKAAYGAIAVNPKSGAAGVSWGYSSQDGAKRRAGRQWAGHCRIAVWVRNGCAAVVATERRYLSEIGSSKRRALRNARRRADNPARRVARVCSG